jgi:hypothetical protein
MREGKLKSVANFVRGVLNKKKINKKIKRKTNGRKTKPSCSSDECFTVEVVDFDCQETEILSQAFILVEYKGIENEKIEMLHRGQYVALCN